MIDKTVQRGEDLLTMYKATLFDFPLARTKSGLGMGKEKEVTEAVWKGYDAWVRLANASIDDLYRNSLFGDLMGRSLDRGLRWQRLNQAAAGAFFAALWPAVGLPTAAAVQALHEEISALNARVKAQDAIAQTLHEEFRALQALREEFRFLIAALLTQSTEDQARAALSGQRATLPLQRNGKGASNGDSQDVMYKKLTSGSMAKDRRKSDAVTH
jgi:hypothetical protein